MSDLTKFFGEPVAVYSMSDALADGVLVDVGPLARDLFTWPVLMTAAAWSDCVEWTEIDAERTGRHKQGQDGRLWDVLWMAFIAIRRVSSDAARATVELYRISREADLDSDAELVTLHAVISTNDEGRPVLVISLPGED